MIEIIRDVILICLFIFCGILVYADFKSNGIVKKCAVIEYPKSEIGIYQAT